MSAIGSKSMSTNNNRLTAKCDQFEIAGRQFSPNFQHTVVESLARHQVRNPVVVPLPLRHSKEIHMSTSKT